MGDRQADDEAAAQQESAQEREAAETSRRLTERRGGRTGREDAAQGPMTVREWLSHRVEELFGVEPEQEEMRVLVDLFVTAAVGRGPIPQAQAHQQAASTLCGQGWATREKQGTQGGGEVEKIGGSRRAREVVDEFGRADASRRAAEETRKGTGMEGREG